MEEMTQVQGDMANAAAAQTKEAVAKEAAEPASERPAAENLWLRGIQRVEWSVERGGDAVWSALKKRPMLSVGLVSLSGLGLASFIGASELVVAIAAGIAAYQVIKKHEPPSKALEEAARFGL